MSNKCPRIESHILTAITTIANAERVVSWCISTRRSASIFVTRWQQRTKRTSRPLSASASFLTSPAHSPPPSAAASKRSLIGALKSKHDTIAMRWTSSRLKIVRGFAAQLVVTNKPAKREVSGAPARLRRSYPLRVKKSPCFLDGEATRFVASNGRDSGKRRPDHRIAVGRCRFNERAALSLCDNRAASEAELIAINF